MSEHLDPDPEAIQDIKAIVEHLKNGFYLHFDRVRNVFQWKRIETRTVLDLTPEVLRKAQKMLRQIRAPFELHRNRDASSVLRNLSDDDVKPDSWVRGRVIEIYQLLERERLLVTFEAYQDGKLVGALLGIDFKPVFLAETMFRRVSDASKFCLCEAVCALHDGGYAFVDVFTPHPKEPPHPLIRLGERTVEFSEYQKFFKEAFVRRLDPPAP